MPDFTLADVKKYLDRNPEIAVSTLAANPGLAEALETEGKGINPSKWHNVRAEAEGMTFQSGHEAAVVMGLIAAEEKGAGVYALRLQVRFVLPNHEVYVADAVYLDNQLWPHVVDAKAFDVKTQKYLTTRDFRRKRRLFREKYPGHDIELL